MKKMIVAGLLISCLTASSAFALEITKGKVLRHKEWTTGNIIKATYETKANPFSLDMEKLIPNKSEFNSSVFTLSAVNLQKGKISEVTTATGYSTTIITNESKTNKTYIYTLETCTGEDAKPQNCAIFQDMIEVEPAGTVFYTQKPSILFIFNKAGAFPVMAKASIKNLDTGSSSMSMSFSEMVISE